MEQSVKVCKSGVIQYKAVFWLQPCLEYSSLHSVMTKYTTLKGFFCTTAQWADCSTMQGYVSELKLGTSGLVICLQTMLLWFHTAKWAFNY